MNNKSNSREEYLSNLINYAGYLYSEEIPERENMEYLCRILHQTVEHFKGEKIDDPCFEADLKDIKRSYDQLKSRLDSLNQIK